MLFSASALLGAQDQEEPLAAGSGNVPVPKKKKHVQPSYPPDALAEGIRGIVILDLIIDTDGRVVDTRTIRSIPGLDEAALIAVRQWLYEPVKVDGKLVKVRLTVPITFALKLPEITRAQGIPELRQGVTPPWPQGSTHAGSATADVTLDPDGRIGLARIIAGEEPWSTSLLQALRTWRFRAPAIDASLSFEVRAEFVPGKEKGTVKLRLASLRETALFDAPEPEESREVAAMDPALTPEPEASEAPGPTPPPDQDPAPEPSEGPEPPAKPLSEAAAAEGAAAASKAASGASSEERTAGEPNEPAPKPPIQLAEATPQPPDPTPPATAGAAAGAPGGLPTSAPGPQTEAADTPPGGIDPTAPPPIEVLTAAPPPLPPENGISAIRGVLLEPGVPDLTRGRRPVSPPFARMAGVGGVVEVEFSVGAGGLTAVQRTNGPDLLQPAATQAVESWIFRRTRADRAYLVAIFTYEDDLSSAIVRPQSQP